MTKVLKLWFPEYKIKIKTVANVVNLGKSNLSTYIYTNFFYTH